jgi:hypothetical protein
MAIPTANTCLCINSASGFQDPDWSSMASVHGCCYPVLDPYGVRGISRTNVAFEIPIFLIETDKMGH